MGNNGCLDYILTHAHIFFVSVRLHDLIRILWNMLRNDYISYAECGDNIYICAQSSKD